MMAMIAIRRKLPPIIGVSRNQTPILGNRPINLVACITCVMLHIG